MKARNLLYAFTLLAYSLSLAHSVIPHHHHKNGEEAVAHHHSPSHHSHSDKHNHDESNGDGHDDHHKKAGHFFFFTHDINADVLVNHSISEQTLKAKKLYIQIAADELVRVQSVSNHQLFHPPKDDSIIQFTNRSSGLLRAPPVV